MIYIVVQDKLTKEYQSYKCEGGCCEIPQHFCICTKRVFVAATLNEYNRLIEHLDNEKKHWDEKGWI